MTNILSFLLSEIIGFFFMISLIEWVFQSLPKQLYINVKKSSSSVDMHIKTSYLKLKYKPDKLE